MVKCTASTIFILIGLEITKYNACIGFVAFSLTFSRNGKLYRNKVKVTMLLTVKHAQAYDSYTTNTIKHHIYHNKTHFSPAPNLNTPQ